MIASLYTRIVATLRRFKSLAPYLPPAWARLGASTPSDCDLLVRTTDGLFVARLFLEPSAFGGVQGEFRARTPSGVWERISPVAVMAYWPIDVKEAP